MLTFLEKSLGVCGIGIGRANEYNAANPAICQSRNRCEGISYVKSQGCVELALLAGAAGTVARYLLGSLVQRLAGAGFPWGTAFVNLLGCLLFGFVWSIAEERSWISSQTRWVVLTGFMGAFTTFSTFVFETGQQMQAAQWRSAFLNVAGQMTLGLAMLFLGLEFGRRLL